MLKADLLHNVYWSRLWIVQELLLSQKLTFQCLSMTFDRAEVMDRYETAADVEAIPMLLASACIRTSSTNRMDGDPRPEHNSVLPRIIISWIHCARDDIRSGKLLPLHIALKAFGAQSCSELHDRILGFSAIAHTHSGLDYMASIMELLVSILGDCMLSLGYDRSDKGNVAPPNHINLSDLGETIRLALQIDWFDPVVYLIVRCTARCFAPQAEFSMCFWVVYGHADSVQRRASPVRYMLAGKTLNEARRESVVGILERAERDGTPLTVPGETGQTRDYQGWVSFTKRICEQLWQRYRLEQQDGGPPLCDIEALLAEVALMPES